MATATKETDTSLMEEKLSTLHHQDSTPDSEITVNERDVEWGRTQCEKSRYGLRPYTKGGLIPSDQKFIQRQRHIMWEFVKSVGIELFKNRDLKSITLPVQIFEPRSYLQRVTDNSGLTFNCRLEKPFNPILGETWQVDYEDTDFGKHTLFVEQTSHHPPVSNWHFSDAEGKVTYIGCAEWKGLIRGNSVKGLTCGDRSLHFKSDGATITMELPTVWIRGAVFGDLYAEHIGNLHVIDEKNNLRFDCELSEESLLSSFVNLFSSANPPPTDVFSGNITEIDTGKKLSTVEGSWLGSISFDKELYFDYVRDFPNFVNPKPWKNALPSDTRYREDLVALAEENIEEAQKMKHVLEEKQRRDASMRKEGKDARKSARN